MARIGVIGGTGQLGKAIARRLAKAGHEVTIGSRSPDRARATAKEIGAASGATYPEAATGREVVIVAVPYPAQGDAYGQIRDAVGDAIVVDTTVPLVPPKVMRVQLPAAGSAAVEAQALLAPGTRLVSAFHSVAAHKLITDDKVYCDVLVFGDDVDARKVVVSLAGDMGLRGLAGGALVNSAAAEALTSILIFMNKAYAADGAGIRFTGLTKAPPAP